MDRSRFTLLPLLRSLKFVFSKVSVMTSNSNKSVAPFFAVKQTPLTATLAPRLRFLEKPGGALISIEA